MKNIFLFLHILLVACNQPTDNNSDSLTALNDETNISDTTKQKYNPKVDSVFFFPADSNAIISDTSFLDYSIKTTIFPIKGKYVISYHEYVDGKPKMRRDKIFYRDYKLQIEIKNKNGFSADKLVSKYDFTSILTPKPDNYFIRNVKFVGLDNNVFRFDIKISFLDNQEPTAMIKCFISKDNSFRFEDYPKSYYDSLNPEPTFIDE